jgi:hypothetical protein
MIVSVTPTTCSPALTSPSSKVRLSLNGSVRVVLTPIAQKDTIRVEMDSGRDPGLRINLNPAGPVGSLDYGELKFAKAGRSPS